MKKNPLIREFRNPLINADAQNNQQEVSKTIGTRKKFATPLLPKQPVSSPSKEKKDSTLDQKSPIADQVPQKDPTQDQSPQDSNQNPKSPTPPKSTNPPQTPQTKPLIHKVLVPKKPSNKKDTPELYYKVYYYRKTSRKKPKGSEDGFLILSIHRFELVSTEGKKILEHSNLHKIRSLRDGEVLTLGMVQVEIEQRISKDDFLSGRCFLEHNKPNLQTEKPILKKVSKTHQVPEGAIILDEASQLFIEPFLGSKLRPHQLEGVKFLFECVSGKKENISGCILADSMGLGKTLQTITLLFTLLRKDASYQGSLRKGIIVTPSSLVGNWKEEITKWLGPMRLCPIACSGPKKEVENNIKTFVGGQSSLLVISYETFMKYSKRLDSACSIIVCDEGHRLKNLQVKTTKCLNELSCKRRILLTGTPLQNNLAEFYACVSFVNPGILGTLSTFKRLYADPIIRGQDPECSDEVKEIAWARSAELSRLTSQFILRRTGSLLENLLPPRKEILVFCKICELQKQLYMSYLCSQLAYKTIENGNAGGALSLITSLRKIVNHPDLIFNSVPKAQDLREIWDSAYLKFPKNYKAQRGLVEYSSKFLFLDILSNACAQIGDKIVVVSNFSKTLDVIQELCYERGYSFLRLDGSTSVKQRMDLVKQFNLPKPEPLMFLLSTKAGGCGLNLIGANRLVLFEPDWNPSNDKQAMGRIWRDGQKKNVYIYRLLTTGTIEEKIYQRQVAKEGLSSIVVDSKNSLPSFSSSYLKELFKLHDKCLTYETGDELGSEGTLLEHLSGCIDLAKEVQAEWNKEVAQEELDFQGATEGEPFKRKLEEQA